VKYKWELDAATVVDAKFGGFGKELVSINGETVVDQRSMKRRQALSFALPDGRTGTITVEPRAFSKPDVYLHVAGRLVSENGKRPFKCGACNAVVRSYDQFCDGCGKALPTAEQRSHERRVNDATGAMRALAWIFLIFGVVMFFIARFQSSSALDRLAGMEDSATVPINGVTYTVAQLRDQVRWEPWGVLMTNMVLAAVMLALMVWGKRAPLPAVIVAMATYLVVQVLNGIVDPSTIAQGVVVKVVIIGVFIRGIKAALALRAADA
jgi:hypothetical protein